MTTFEKEATERFAEFNLTYFGNRLKVYRIIAAGRFGPGGMCRKRQREIYLPVCAGVELDRILLHEMAHAAAKRHGHGKSWLAEMKRLADMRAPTLEDWSAYQDQNKVLTSRHELAEAEDAGFNNPDVDWSNYRIYIGQQLGLVDTRGRSEAAAPLA